MRALALMAVVLISACDDAPVEKLDAPTGPFFALASGTSVARCAAEAKAFDTNRRAEQARKVELACQGDMNATGVSDACREYANAIWVASGKFQLAMEADAGRGAVYGDDMRMHKDRAKAVAGKCV